MESIESQQAHDFQRINGETFATSSGSNHWSFATLNQRAVTTFEMPSDNILLLHARKV